MHEGEYLVSSELVHQLLKSQFPQFSDRPIVAVASAGTDNALFRLGDDLLVRMPIIDWAVADVAKEQRWLPYLAPHVPVQIPTPISLGAPEHGYPCDWSIYRWCAGGNPVVGGVVRPLELASHIAQFILAMRTIDPTGAPVAERGRPLVERDDSTRSAIAEIGSTLDTGKILKIWQAALELPSWVGPDHWIHGDLSAGNLLIVDSELSAVIDFGAMGIGDPAADLIIAWNLLPIQARPQFRSEAGLDEASWKRGRALALSIALIQLPYYRRTNLPLAQNALYVIDQVLADHEAE